MKAKAIKPMTKEYNSPVTIQIYLGSGKPGIRLRENLKKKVPPKGSLSELVVAMMRKADPALFKGVDDGSV